MSTFKKKLTELMSSAYASEENESRGDMHYGYHYGSEKGSDISFIFKNRMNQSQSQSQSQAQSQSQSQSQGNSKRYSKQFAGGNINNSLSYYDHNAKPSTSQSFLKKRGITTDIMNNSAISPLYTEKASFAHLQTENSINSQMFRYRLDSRNKQQTRIKKEIDFLSQSFKEKLLPQGNFNRPVVSLNKPEYENFSINYASSIAMIKDKTKMNRTQTDGRQGKYVSYPIATLGLGLLDNRKEGNGQKMNGGTIGRLMKSNQKNDLDDLYELLNRQKNKKH